MQPIKFKLLYLQLMVLFLPVAVGLAAINHQLVWGGLLIVLVESGVRWRERQLNFAQLRKDSLVWLMGLSSLIIVALSPNFIMQLVMTGLYGLMHWWLGRSEDAGMIVAAAVQSAVLWGIFLGAAVWHWPTLIILVLSWTSAWLVADRIMANSNDRAAKVLVLTWALIVAECSWIFSLWLVNYIMFNGVLIVPQPALVITALGYCLAGIYLSHRRSQLSRTRLIEYLLVGLVILLVVISGTRWNGAI